MPDNDAQLELKKRARRRLVGAAALALAAAIVLPVIMDETPRSISNELQIRIPSQEGGNYASRLITAKPAPEEMAPSVAEPVPEAPSAPVAVPASAAVASASPAVVASAPTAVKPPSVDEAARVQALLEGKTPEAKPAVVPAEKPVAKPAVKASEKPASQPSAVTTKFYVQLGVYRELENARSVQARLKSAGFTGIAERVGDRTRVKVGPFSSRQAADAAVAKLKKAGLPAVVAPVR